DAGELDRGAAVLRRPRLRERSRREERREEEETDGGHGNGRGWVGVGWRERALECRGMRGREADAHAAHAVHARKRGAGARRAFAGSATPFPTAVPFHNTVCCGTLTPPRGLPARGPPALGNTGAGR